MSTIPIIQDEDVLFESDEFPEYSPLKEYISRIRCVVCQKTEGRDSTGEKVEPIDYVPSMVNVSDPAHVKTRGAGGPDAENIVPLCHYHHQELHNVGIITFQLHYDINLKEVAILIFEQYSKTVSEDDYAEQSTLEHNKILSRIHSIKNQIVELGNLLIKFRDTDFNGKPMYQWCGFTTFSQYISAPIKSGGLGIPSKTMYRWIRAAELKNELPDCPVEDLGAVKADMIYPIIKGAKSYTEKRKLFNEAMESTHSELGSYVNNKLGREDPRQARHARTVKLLNDFFGTISVEVAPEYTEAFAWQLMKSFNS